MSNRSLWRKYKNSLLPTSEPHEVINPQVLDNEEIWKEAPKALFARWTSDFDCGEETSWWYVIKDCPFDISELKSNRRYKINKGKRLFRVERIVPAQYAHEIYEVQKAAFTTYPKKYRPQIECEVIEKKARTNWMAEDVVMYAAFFRETGEFAGVTLLTQREKCLDLNAQWVKPEFEKYCVNAALVEGMLSDWSKTYTEGAYVCDGERNILHETAFQDYLERYFGFRKAYCKLNIRYRPGIGWLVKCLYPFRKLLLRLGKIGIIHKINGVLLMEACARK